ncbi:UmoD family flagellar biogenesis regulator [Xenorhabdus innexi]|uniref:UmoD n=1 Tax=Xenorhabdus innexi TaxID=290109 RepID=A0A1N6MZB9_9GAMM|nr:UmoD family flagellar biogenesis regulator [Xenorhabdus innexi]PHM33449.1 UmoD [Xenorhabdus innexi]SIP74109.1 putative UmoD [Xenorhabdus innexi]
MSKIKTRQCGIYSLIVIITIGIYAMLFPKNPQPKHAQVLSSEPIITIDSAPKYYCNGMLLPLLTIFVNTENNHSSVYENSIFSFIELLNITKKYYSLSYYELKNCITFQNRELRIIGYDVIYTIGNKPGKVRVIHKPDQLIPLDGKGKLILAPYL